MKLKKFKFIWLLAKRDLTQDKKITIIVIAMLGFSFLNLAFFPAFVEGLTGTFNAGMIETQTGHVSVNPENEYIEDAGALKNKISRLEGVNEVEKRIETTAFFSYKDERVGAKIIGTSSLDSEVYKSRIQKGNFLAPGDEKKIVLGTSLAGRDDGLNVDRGRKITVISEEYNYKQDYKVVGTIGRPGPSGLFSQAIVPYDDLEEMVGEEGVATSIKILLENRNPAEFKRELQELNIGGEIETWSEQSKVAGSIAQTFSIVTFTFSIVGVIITLASVGVVIFINTNKRAREMGIIRAIGTQSNQVIGIFVLEALLLGIAGVIFGSLTLIALNKFLALNPIMSPMGPLSTVVTSKLIWTRSIVMLVSSLVAGFIPAYMISKDNIIETIEER